MIKYFPLLIMFFLWGCVDTQTIYSPDKKQCLTFIHQTDFGASPNDVFIYYGKPPLDKSRYIRMGWTNDFGISVCWYSKPLKIRTVTLINENTVPTHLIDVQKYPIDNTIKEDSGNLFISYDLPELMTGKYN